MEKPVSWYHNEMIAANPPTSQITQAAMQAGIEYGKTGVTAKKAAAQKFVAAKPPTYARGKRPVIDPSIGMRVSKEVAATLISKGARDTTEGRVEGLAKAVAALPPVVKDVTSTKASSGPNQSVVTAKTNFNVASRLASEVQGKGPSQASQSQVSNTSVYFHSSHFTQMHPLMPAQKSSTTPDPAVSDSVKARGCVKSKQAIVSLLDDEETLSELSSVEAEDPKDASFGQRITTPLKVNNSKILTRSGNKRKATPPKSDGTPSVNKRSRTTMDATQTDGTCDDPPSSASEYTCSSMLKATQRERRGRMPKP